MCSIEDCDNNRIEARGWCGKHYKRWQVHGDPLAGKHYAPYASSIQEKLEFYGWDIVPGPLDTPCWEWRGQRNNDGYGKITTGTATRKPVHRLAFETWVGPIPEDQPIVRHRCDNPPCINPEHLLVGTQADNVRDMIDRGRLVPPPNTRKKSDGQH